ncbi:pleckstrin homology-like domain family B member 3 isoform X5 [Catharus ustulatus]|uniref:pleckstrin homology-like domain family B member 3 isoform X5 n=1 Tax=Catharus ustulatus TaxID=91951 RepID=UPI00140D3A16|nr:pleckstrin homology-like domain family B member 3 isoform X5 [Catharus ustulatus]
MLQLDPESYSTCLQLAQLQLRVREALAERERLLRAREARKAAKATPTETSITAKATPTETSITTNATPTEVPITTEAPPPLPQAPPTPDPAPPPPELSNFSPTSSLPCAPAGTAPRASGGCGSWGGPCGVPSPKWAEKSKPGGAAGSTWTPPGGSWPITGTKPRRSSRASFTSRPSRKFGTTPGAWPESAGGAATGRGGATRARPGLGPAPPAL